MIKYFCDRCGKELDRSYRAHISYSGNEEAYFCKGCFEEFLNWMKNNPVKDDEKKIEDYEKTIHSYEEVIHSYEEAIHGYQQQIIDLTEKLDKTRASRTWWSNQCNAIFKDCDALRNKIDEIMAHGSVR